MTVETDLAFHWITAGGSDQVRAALGPAGAPIRELATDSSYRTDESVVQLLEWSGLHLDQQQASEQGAEAVLIEGTTSLSTLAAAIRERAGVGGLVVDARFNTVEVYEHPAVGVGTVVYADFDGCRLLSNRDDIERLLTSRGGR